MLFYEGSPKITDFAPLPPSPRLTLDKIDYITRVKQKVEQIVIIGVLFVLILFNKCARVCVCSHSFLVLGPK